MTDVRKTDMTPAMQIDASIREGFANVVLGIMGGVTPDFDLFTYQPCGEEKDDVTCYAVTAKVTDQISIVIFTATVPVRHPDSVSFLHRVDDVVFVVDTSLGQQYQAWCEHEIYNGAIAIVRCPPGHKEAWIVAGTLDDKILHMGDFSRMEPRWKQIVQRVWPDMVTAT